MKNKNKMPTPCYLFDIDGTLADLSHRLHHIQKVPKDWDSFFAACKFDAAIKPICTLASDLLDAGCEIIFVSGRSDQCREDTISWLTVHVFCEVGTVFNLYMRKAGDHRPDDIVKSELLGRIIADGYAPIMVFDDRNQVVRMWRKAGIPCAQVAEGNF